MSNLTVIEYLEKYSVAPSPSRDYYGVKVIGDKVILYTWKISHGPHINPIVRVARFCDFNKDKTMQNEIEWIFGEPLLHHIQDIVKNNGGSLLTLPKNLLRKITGYLRLKDILKLSTLSRIANEVFNGDAVWEILYRRYKIGLVYRDERERGSSYGWKQLFKERKMHKSAKDRNYVQNKSSNIDNVIPKNIVSSKNSSLMKTPTLKNTKGITSGGKLIRNEVKNQKSVFSKSNNNSARRFDKNENSMKSDAEIGNGKLFGSKKLTVDNGISSANKSSSNVLKKYSIKSVDVSASSGSLKNLIISSENLVKTLSKVEPKLIKWNTKMRDKSLHQQRSENFFIEQDESVKIYKKFQAPEKPKKIDEKFSTKKTENETIKKLYNVKNYLKLNGNELGDIDKTNISISNFIHDKIKSSDSKTNLSAKPASLKMLTDNKVTRNKSQSVIKTGNSSVSDQRSITIGSSKKIEQKKRTILRKKIIKK